MKYAIHCIQNHYPIYFYYNLKEVPVQTETPFSCWIYKTPSALFAATVPGWCITCGAFNLLYA